MAGPVRDHGLLHQTIEDILNAINGEAGAGIAGKALAGQDIVGNSLTIGPNTPNAANGGATFAGTIPVSTTTALIQGGPGPFDGVSAGFFTASAAGNLLGLNAASGFTGRLVDIQIAGVSQFALDKTGVGMKGGLRIAYNGLGLPNLPTLLEVWDATNAVAFAVDSNGIYAKALFYTNPGKTLAAFNGSSYLNTPGVVPINWAQAESKNLTVPAHVTTTGGDFVGKFEGNTGATIGDNGTRIEALVAQTSVTFTTTAGTELLALEGAVKVGGLNSGVGMTNGNGLIGVYGHADVAGNGNSNTIAHMRGIWGDIGTYCGVLTGPYIVTAAASGYFSKPSSQANFTFTTAYSIYAEDAVAIGGTFAAPNALVSGAGDLTLARGGAFWGHAAVASQPAAPVLLSDVIAIIRGCGLSA